MNINLQRPIVFLDLETTGLNLAADRIVEIALLKVDHTGNRSVKRKLINPERIIPSEVSAIHVLDVENMVPATAGKLSPPPPPLHYNSST